MKRGTPRHPKVDEFALALGRPRYVAVGLLEMLWHFTAEFAHAGDIGRFSDDAIAKALCWDGTSTELVSCLVHAGWVDRCDCHRLRVHDWPDHADQTVQRVLEKRGQRFISCYDETSIKLAKTSQPSPSPSPSPSPIPSPTPLPLPVKRLEREGIEVPKFNPEKGLAKSMKLTPEPTEAGKLDDFKAALDAAFKRPSGTPWSYADESMMFELSRRPGLQDELRVILDFKKRDPQYFPQSISRLLNSWDETLDRARNKVMVKPNGQKTAEQIHIERVNAI